MLSLNHMFEKFRAQGNLRALRRAAMSLQQKYALSSSPTLEDDEYTAYFLYRMPATLAATTKVLEHVRERLPRLPRTMLDIGAGPGTAMMAALDVFPDLESALGMERSSDFVPLFHTWSRHVEETRAQLVVHDMNTDTPEGYYDLVVASYSYGELSDDVQKRWLAWAKDHCSIFVIVEPGTPARHALLLTVREQCIAMGGTVIAPCAHQLSCPMTSGWCHFSIRVSRSFIHKYVKNATVGYEDEAVGYLAIVFDQSFLPTEPLCRIVQTPKHRSGHTIMELCTPRGSLEERVVSRRHKEAYARVKRARWGDGFPDLW